MVCQSGLLNVRQTFKIKIFNTTKHYDSSNYKECLGNVYVNKNDNIHKREAQEIHRWSNEH